MISHTNIEVIASQGDQPAVNFIDNVVYFNTAKNLNVRIDVLAKA
jgi:hypothetical protein